MSTPRHDLVVAAGTTLGTAVRFHQPGARVAAGALVAGQWVYYCGTPWPVYSAEPGATSTHVRLGLGLWWEPDLLLPLDLETVEAEPQAWATVTATWLDEYGRGDDVPTELSADALTLTLVPHTTEAAQWSTDLAERITTDVADLDPSPAPDVWVQQRPRLTYGWSLLGTFTGLTSPRSVLCGTLVITPTAGVLAPVPVP